MTPQISKFEVRTFRKGKGKNKGTKTEVFLNGSKISEFFIFDNRAMVEIIKIDLFGNQIINIEGISTEIIKSDLNAAISLIETGRTM